MGLGNQQCNANELPDCNCLDNSDILVTFYGSNCWNKDYTDATNSSANAIFICESQPDSAGDTVRYLTELKLKYPCRKAIVDIGPFFFQDGQLTPRQNLPQRWDQFVSHTSLVSDRIAAFYLPDEAYGSNDLPADQVLQRLETVTSIIKSSVLSDKKILLSYSALHLWHALNTYKVPNGVDWVGVDCYDTWNNCAESGFSLPDLLNYLEAHLNPQQKMFIFPNAFVYDNQNTPDAEVHWLKLRKTITNGLSCIPRSRQ